MNRTQPQKVIQIMIRTKKEWFHGEDVLNAVGIFVGYKGATVLSGLSVLYPEMIEKKKSDKNNHQLMYRFRFENSAQFLTILPDKLRSLVIEELRNHKKDCTKYVNKPTFNKDHSKVVGFKKVKELV